MLPIEEPSSLVMFMITQRSVEPLTIKFVDFSDLVLNGRQWIPIGRLSFKKFYGLRFIGRICSARNVFERLRMSSAEIIEPRNNLFARQPV